jgi:hypothetical protein
MYLLIVTNYFPHHFCWLNIVLIERALYVWKCNIVFFYSLKSLWFLVHITAQKPACMISVPGAQKLEFPSVFDTCFCNKIILALLHVLCDLSTNQIAVLRWFYTECVWAFVCVLSLQTGRPKSLVSLLYSFGAHPFHVFIRFCCYHMVMWFAVFHSLSSSPPPVWKCLMPLKYELDFSGSIFKFTRNFMFIRCLAWLCKLIITWLHQHGLASESGSFSGN